MRGVRALCITSDAGQDLVRGFGPHEGLGIFIVHLDVLADGRFQFANATEHAAANSLVSPTNQPTISKRRLLPKQQEVLIHVWSNDWRTTGYAGVTQRNSGWI